MSKQRLSLRRPRRWLGLAVLGLLAFAGHSHDAAAQCAVTAPDQVALYTDSNYGGRCVVRGIGDYPTSSAIGLPEDSISSIAVGIDAQAYVCADSWFESTCELFTGNDSSLGNNSIGHDRISSVKVQRRGTSTACIPNSDQVAFFRDSNFTGPCVVKSRGDYPLPDAIGLRGDSISSLKVGANAQGVLCRDTSLLGDCQAFVADAASLSGMRIGNDVASSVRVMARGEVDCSPASGQVAFYQHQDFLKPCVVRTFGDYPSSAALGVPEDSVSSVRLGAGTQAVVCNDSNYGGRCIVLSGNTANLAYTTVGTDTLSSARVQTAGYTECTPQAGQIALFKHSDFVAPCVVLKAGDYPTPTAMAFENDAVSSIRIGNGAQAEVCTGAYYEGNCILFTSSESNFGNTEIGHDSTSSIRVQAAGTRDCIPAAGQVAVFEHSDFLYPCATRGQGNYARAADFGIADNSMSSIRIGSGVQACVCSAADFREVCEAFTGDDANFGNNRIGHDSASSLRVQPVGATCVAAAPVGVKTLSVHNCNTSNRPVYLWLHDLGTGSYDQKGTLAAQYDGGSCPGSSAPFNIDLPAGHNVQLIAVDPGLGSCGSNDPARSPCQRLITGAISGDANGTVQPITVN